MGDSMKAIYIEHHGDIGNLIFGDFEDPSFGPNEVLIKVRASSVNRRDIFTRMGVKGTKLDLDTPQILGGDASGDVIDFGEDVTGIRINDRVVINPMLTCDACNSCNTGRPELCPSYGMLGTNRNGSYAEYLSVPSRNVHKIPDNVSYESAASLPTVFLPCWSIFLRRANLKPNETALVLSGSGGVGTSAIQVAKNVVGATVIATTSADSKGELIKHLGADEVINYTSEDVHARVMEITDGRGVDVVLDSVGSDFWEDAFRSLALGGRYGICGVTTGYKAQLQMGLMFMKNLTVFGSLMGSREDLDEIIEAASDGLISPLIAETFLLDQVPDAHKLMESMAFTGKIVIRIS